MLRKKLSFVLIGLLLLTARVTLADESLEISKLMRAGQIDAAATRLEAALSLKPKDAQLRFLRGVIQIEQKKPNEAIATFQRMTEDFPELPEPYNNLAVLYANQGQYDKSRAALELAIRTHPAYATAHENLGDVYAKMASESYNKALSLDAGNNSAQFKLNLIKELIGSKTVKPQVPEPVAAKPVVIASVVASKASTVSNTPAPVVASNQVAAVAPKPLAVTTPNATLIVTKENAEADVIKAAQNWALAWSKKDLEGYFAAYTPNFKPHDGASHKQWAAERRQRIEAKRSIQVGMERTVVKVDGDAAVLKFKQSYKADGLKVSSSKTLTFSRVEGKWLITGEKTGA